MRNTTLRPSLWDTPLGRTRLNALDEHHARAIADAESPWETAQAYVAYRQERYTETGLLGLPGTGQTYHWGTGSGFGASLFNIADTLTDCHSSGTVRDRAKAVLGMMTKAVGWRWQPGVNGLLARLDECGVAPSRRAVFIAEREAFEQRFAALADAAGTLLHERLPAQALDTAARAHAAMLDECDGVANWLEHARLQADADWLRHSAASARGLLARRHG